MTIGTGDAGGRELLWDSGSHPGGGGAMAPKPSVRIGNAERDRAADLLGEHFRAGRLDVHEYDERITAAYAAKTDEDLRPLFADLPGTGASAQQKRPYVEPTSGPYMPVSVLVLRGVGLAILGLIAVGLVISSAPFILIGLLIWLKVSGRMWGGRYWRGPGGRTGYYRSRGWA
jgi:hypothetical protein